MTNECKGCKVRRVGCHANCGSYQAFCAENETQKTAKRLFLRKNSEPIELLCSGYRKRSKKRKLPYGGK